MRILVLTLMMSFLSQSAFGAAEGGGDAAGTSAEKPTLEELCERISAKRREIQAAEQRALPQEHRLTLQRELKELEEEINHKITITINGELLQPPPSRCSFTCLFRNRKIKPVIQIVVNIVYGQLDYNNLPLRQEMTDYVKKLYFNEITKIQAANSLDEGRLSEIEALHSESYMSVPTVFCCGNKHYLVTKEGPENFRVYRNSFPVTFDPFNQVLPFYKAKSPSDMLKHSTLVLSTDRPNSH